ncbi:MAG: hypothetical protein HYZ27_00755, partial [Deltaproteobacteria bacterium]|nr:hypothetical protein [Deltaproteobacteria bacterium]
MATPGLRRVSAARLAVDALEIARDWAVAGAAVLLAGFEVHALARARRVAALGTAQGHAHVVCRFVTGLVVKLGAKRAGACDINAACSGFIYALQHADALIRAGVHRTILVAGSEIMTARLDWTKRDTAVLFGDGAGAVVVQASPEAKDAPSGFVLGCDSNHA